ncbi:MAG: Holliday junction branch migration DNA helicase RuvB [Rhabdochlamydiaceae bacterium]|nr:Holliday junction branch migration DNA helicase RuvB [Rhabdochlamydiaceae bacterium]
MSEENYIESTWAKTDEVFETPLRPQTLEDFSGQESIRERLNVLMGAAKQRKEPVSHCLFYGPPGLGKTTLANIVAKSMGTKLTVTSGPIIEKAGDLAGLLTNLQEGDVLFIDEIHRLNRVIEEYLYPAMEDFTLDLLIDSGPNARSIQVKLNRFTLIGATTRAGLLTGPMRSRFPFTCRLDYYTSEVLTKIILRSSNILHISLEEAAALEISSRSRGTPRIANNLLRWVRDYAQMKQSRVVDRNMAIAALDMLAIDYKGLDEMDKKILEVLIDHYSGGPVGISTLAVAVGEEAETLAEVYEPYLILQGFMKRTPRGREATVHAYSHIGRPIPSKFHSGEPL